MFIVEFELDLSSMRRQLAHDLLVDFLVCNNFSGSLRRLVDQIANRRPPGGLHLILPGLFQQGPRRYFDLGWEDKLLGETRMSTWANEKNGDSGRHIHEKTWYSGTGNPVCAESRARQRLELPPD
jgi:hypothetical protein